MYYKYFSVVLILLSISRIQDASYTNFAIETINFISSITTIYLGTQTKLAPDETLHQIDRNILKISEIVAMKLNDITSQINNIESNIENYILEREFLKQYEEIYNKIDRIDFLYNETQLWANSLSSNKSWDLERKTDDMISLGADYPQSVLFELKKMFFQTRKSKKQLFLNTFFNVLQMKCDENITPHYQLFSFYKQIIYAEVQGMAAIAFAYVWRAKHNSYTHELEEVRYERIKNIIEYTRLFKNKMKLAKNFIRRCDGVNKENKNIIGVFKS